jgi:hypothetical protein
VSNTLYQTRFKVRVCKSVHHHTFNWINKPQAANSQVYYLSFKYSSTYIRTSSYPSSGATTTAVAASGLPSEFGDSSAVCRNRADLARPRPTALISPSSDGQPEAATAVVCAPDDGWKYHPKHVGEFPDINKLCKVASCWIYNGIYLRCTDP